MKLINKIFNWFKALFNKHRKSTEIKKPNKTTVINGIGLDVNYLLERRPKNDNHNLNLKDYLIKNSENGGLLIRGSFYKNDINNPFTFKNINLSNITISNYKHNALKIQSMYSKVNLKNITINQTNKVAELNGGSKGLSLVTDIRYPKNGLSIKIDQFKVNNPRASFMYLQNPYSYDIQEIVCNNALYNKDGTDALIYKGGVALMKWKHYGDCKNRTFKVGKILITGSNINPNLKTVNGEDASIYRNCFRIEGDNATDINIEIREADFDLPFSIKPASTINKLTARNKIKGHRSSVTNSVIDTLILKDTWFDLKENCSIKNLIITDSILRISKETVINNINNINSQIIIS